MHNRVNKHDKIRCRVREIKQEKLDKLYSKIDFICHDCMYDCKSTDGMKDITDCENKKVRENINDLIEMIKEQNVNLNRFCEDYHLKIDILLMMLKGEIFLTYKYYWCLAHRLRINDEYDSYKDRFEIKKQILNTESIGE